MKSFFFSVVGLIFLLNCKKSETSYKNFVKISDWVQYQNNGHKFILKSGKFTYNFDESELPFKKVILLNSSMIGFFTELEAENKIIGISSPEYIYSKEILNLIREKKIENIGNEQKYNVEKIIALRPDVIFTNYVANFENTYNLLIKNGIKIIFLDEYLEQNPIEKSKYLLIFGKLLGIEKFANEKLSIIEKNYNTYKQLAIKSKTKPIVLTNEMYGSQWFLAGGKSNLANFIADANADYILKINNESQSVPLSFEEVFVKFEKAKFWVNLGNHHSKKELLQINPNYSKMEVFKSGKLYALTEKEKGKANDYFESGVVRADKVLKDYITIFHPEIFPKDSLMYMNQLK